jgi:hypothetical protein
MPVVTGGAFEISDGDDRAAGPQSGPTRGIPRRFRYRTRVVDHGPAVCLRSSAWATKT